MNSNFFDKTIFAKNLKRLLVENDITASELARRLDVSKSSVADWKKGVSLPRMDKVDMICAVLHCTRSDLVEPQLPKALDNCPEISGAVPVSGFIPVYGEIPAGAPAFEEEYIIDYISTTFSRPDDYFALKVKGTSMINAGIPDGAYVTFHKQSYAEDRDIVACRINGEEVTLKRFRRQGDSVVLMPENPEFLPIMVNAIDFVDGRAQILGVAKNITITL